MTNFSEALKALKQGKSVARKGWNGKGMNVFLSKGYIPVEDPPSDMTDEDMGTLENRVTEINGVPIELFNSGYDSKDTTYPSLSMIDSKGNIVNGWLASQTDLLAEDYIINE